MAAWHRISALEGLLLIVLGGFATAFLVLSWEFGQTAAMFPRLVAEASLVLLALAVALRLLGKGELRKKQVQMAEAEPPDAIPWPVALGIQVGYIALIVLVGFSLATLVYLIGSPLHMRYRRWAVLSAYAVFLTLAVVVSFTYLFHVRLPEGLLFSSLKIR